MFRWIPVNTTDIYIQREIDRASIVFHLTFIHGNELNGQMSIPDKATAAIIELRNLVTAENQEQISLDRLFLHL